jgi:solute carrier family 38 (sodium-coupled neutral amino acid transporter), member 11
MYAYGAMTAYMLIIGDTVPVVMDYAFGDGSPSRDVVIILVAVFIILPLSLLRDMSSLAFTSLLSISADLIMIFFVIINAPITARKEDIQVTSKEYNFITYQIFEGIGTFSFAFVCQHNTFIVFESMRDPNLIDWTKVSHGSLAIAASMCLTLGLAGYLNFGDETEGDILNNFSEDGTLNIL